MKSLLHYFKIHLVNFIENSPTEKSRFPYTLIK